MDIKYIKLRGGFITFPESIRHDTIVQSGQVIKSAGFIKQLNGELFCVGESTNLGVGSLPEDTQELREWLGVIVNRQQIMDLKDGLGTDTLAGVVDIGQLRKENTQLTALLALADARAKLHQEANDELTAHVDELRNVLDFERWRNKPVDERMAATHTALKRSPAQSLQSIQRDVLDGVVNYLVDDLGCDHIAGLIATDMPRKY